MILKERPLHSKIHSKFPMNNKSDRRYFSQFTHSKNKENMREDLKFYDIFLHHRPKHSPKQMIGWVFRLPLDKDASRTKDSTKFIQQKGSSESAVCYWLPLQCIFCTTYTQWKMEDESFSFWVQPKWKK